MSLIHIYGMITSQLDSFRTGINYMINVIKYEVSLYSQPTYSLIN